MLIRMQSRVKPAVGARINPSHPLARGLAGCWLLNEGTGRVVHDASGYRHEGDFSGGPVWATGSLGREITFDGNDGWISMGDCLDPGTDDITVLALLRYDATHQPNEWMGTHIGAIVGKGYLDGSGRGYGLFVETDNRVHWQVRNQTNAFSAISDYPLNDGRYHTVIGVCDRDDSMGVRLYVDGVRQAVTADASVLSGIELNGSRAFAIGSRQEEASGAWYWDFLGSVAMVCVWKRILADSEIRRLQQSPFAMLVFRHAINMLSPAPATIIQCAGSIQAFASTWAAARITRDLAAALRPAFNAMLQTGTAWQREALFNGATHNAWKLGTVLTQGWFWMRRRGCTAVYRGPGVAQVDLSRILHVAGPDAVEVPLPAYLSHAAGSTHCYLIRRFNGCGYQEKTVAAATVLRVASDGQLAQAQPNTVFGLTGRQADPGSVRLIWFYCPLDQKTMPAQFNLYQSDATGAIDFGAPIGVVRYEGRRFYCFRVVDLTAGRHLFAVAAADADAVGDMSVACLIHETVISTPPPAVILTAAPV